MSLAALPRRWWSRRFTAPGAWPWPRSDGSGNLFHSPRVEESAEPRFLI